MDLGSGPCNNNYHCAAKIKHDCVNKLADSNTTKARSATHFATNRIIRAAWDAIIIRVQLRMCQFFLFPRKTALKTLGSQLSLQYDFYQTQCRVKVVIDIYRSLTLLSLKSPPQ